MLQLIDNDYTMTSDNNITCNEYKYNFDNIFEKLKSDKCKLVLDHLITMIENPNNGRYLRQSISAFSFTEILFANYSLFTDKDIDIEKELSSGSIETYMGWPQDNMLVRFVYFKNDSFAPVDDMLYLNHLKVLSDIIGDNTFITIFFDKEILSCKEWKQIFYLTVIDNILMESICKYHNDITINKSWNSITIAKNYNYDDPSLTFFVYNYYATLCSVYSYFFNDLKDGNEFDYALNNLTTEYCAYMISDIIKNRCYNTDDYTINKFIEDHYRRR